MMWTSGPGQSNLEIKIEADDKTPKNGTLLVQITMPYNVEIKKK